jgi:hypothetical protein
MKTCHAVVARDPPNMHRCYILKKWTTFFIKFFQLSHSDKVVNPPFQKNVLFLKRRKRRGGKKKEENRQIVFLLQMTCFHILKNYSV